MQRHGAGSMSFPPLLSSDKWGATSTAGRRRPRATPKPLALHGGTLQDLKLATGDRYELLQSAARVDARSAASDVAGSEAARPDHFRQIFPAAIRPQGSIFAHCKRTGHATMTNPVAGPAIRDLSGWFAEYGRPSGPGNLRTEFARNVSLVPRGDGETTNTVRMLKGRVLR